MCVGGGGGICCWVHVLWCIIKAPSHTEIWYSCIYTLYKCGKWLKVDRPWQNSDYKQMGQLYQSRVISNISDTYNALLLCRELPYTVIL